MIPSQLENQDYINLETYKKNGDGVKTPVWFVTDNDKIYIITRSQTGKVKRIKNNPKVKICPCTFSGKPKGQWIKAAAKKVQESEAQKAISLRKKKYGFKALLAGFLSKTKGELVVYEIIPD